MEATQKDSQSMCGRIVACESRIKELTKQLQPENLWQTIENKYEHKLKRRIGLCVRDCGNATKNKRKQEMDNVLETKLETVNKDITSATETLTKVKQNAEEEKLREIKICNLIIHNVPEPDNPNKEDRVKHDDDFCLETLNKILQVGVGRSGMKKMMRLGKYTSSTAATGKTLSSLRPRPLLIQFRDRIIKNQVLRIVFRENYGYSNEYQSVYIKV